MNVKAAGGLVLAVALAACGSTAPSPRMPADDLSAQFAYDRGAPLEVTETSTSESGGTKRTEIEYANGRGGRAGATLIAPAGSDRRPGLIMSPGSNQSRIEMRDEGLAYANALGVVVLIIDQSQIAARRSMLWTFTSQDRVEAIESVVDIVRGVDLLRARADVDPARVGVYAFSYGAWLAVMSAAIDDRISLLVLRSGGPQILRELAGAARASRADFQTYVELMSAVDQSRYAPKIPATVSVLVQNGSADRTYPADGVPAWQAAIGGTKVARIYEGAGHLLDRAASDDALAFIRERWQRP